MASGCLHLLLLVTSSSKPPADIFDRTSRLLVAYLCPFAKAAWIARNYKGLQYRVKLIAIDLESWPAWYQQKLYPANGVRYLLALCADNNQVKGGSIEIINYFEENFEGPSVLPDDPARKAFAEKLLSYSNSFYGGVISSFMANGAGKTGAAFDYLEDALGKFDDGPFFLGQFSLVDMVFAPHIEMFQPFLLDFKKYDITEGRPKLAAWIEEVNKIKAYTATKFDPDKLLATLKRRFKFKVVTPVFSLSGWSVENLLCPFIFLCI
nr:protein IN2-1 homolog B-like [Coffea arabica]XP_027089580.1 protein IN2-1 homolog B-like [Coffea arabica]